MYKWLCRIGFLFSVFLCLQVGEVTAQPQSPSEFLGYELGSRWTPHHKVMDYIRHIAEESPLVEARKYGESNEGRSLMLIYISAESNMDRLEQIQVNNLKRTSLIEGEPSAEKTAIVWLSYNVHGNEPSSSEAAMKTLYELVRRNTAKTNRWQENVVVINHQMHNPNRQDRNVSWYNQTARDDTNVHPAAR